MTDGTRISCRLFRKAVQQGRSKRRGESYSRPYVEPLSVARTPLADFVNSLLRQREVLQLIAEGKGTRSIASMLNISVKTVEFHRAKVMEELDLHSVAELTRYAVSEGLVSL
ncbi:MAG: hypothetical protein HP496_12585 [Nitrospira sp.]|nr:hypothetical protein [Nitrospira sp.]